MVGRESSPTRCSTRRCYCVRKASSASAPRLEKAMTMASRTGIPAIAVSLAVGAVAAALPWFGASSYMQVLVYYATYYLTLRPARNLISGVTVHVSFAHGALAG